jgi:hypothetical protein
MGTEDQWFWFTYCVLLLATWGLVAHYVYHDF